MSLELLSPLGALFVLAAALPLAAFAWVERRSSALRSVLALDDPGWRPKLPVVAAVVAIPVLLAVALAQPVIRYTGVHRVRTDAEAFYVFDVSRSMSASRSPESPRRFDQALAVAERAHQQLANIPSGIATLTDRVVPSLFPTGNDEVFTASLEDALTIGQPPPRGYDDVGTLFEAVDTLASGTFFSPAAKHRVAIVLTDGESRPFDPALLREALARRPEGRLRRDAGRRPARPRVGRWVARARLPAGSRRREADGGARPRDRRRGGLAGQHRRPRPGGEVGDGQRAPGGAGTALARARPRAVARARDPHPARLPPLAEEPVVRPPVGARRIARP